MVDIIRPNFGTVWAASGEKLSPTEIKIQGGWIQEMMPYQYQNFLQNRVDNAITYLLQKGVPEWDASQEYTANKSVVTYAGQMYMAITTNTNVLPSVVASWKRLTITFGTNGAIPVSFGGTGATNAADARSNLGIGTAATANLPATDGLLVKLDDNSLVARRITGIPGYINVSNPTGVSGNPTINVGANVAKTDADAAWTTKTSIRLPTGSTSERGVGVSGRIRFNTELNRFEGYNGTEWSSLGDAPGVISSQTISTNGIQSSFTLTFTPASKYNILVYNNGIYQDPSAFTLTGTTLSFSESPETGVLTIVPLSAAPVAARNSWAPQAAIPDAVPGTEIATINSILAVMRTAGLILP